MGSRVPYRKPSRRPAILIADDDPVARDLLQYQLEELGFEVHAAQDGNDALRALKGKPGYFRLVILDVCMPGPLAGGLYKDARRVSPSVPVLFCSAFDLESSDLDFDGPQPVLQKPFRIADVQSALRDMLGDCEPATALCCSVT